MAAAVPIKSDKPGAAPMFAPETLLAVDAVTVLTTVVVAAAVTWRSKATMLCCAKMILDSKASYWLLTLLGKADSQLVGSRLVISPMLVAKTPISMVAVAVGRAPIEMLRIDEISAAIDASQGLAERLDA